MEHPVAKAFCPLLFASNGGQFNDLGQPLWNLRVKGKYVKGKCDRAFDCGECYLLADWLESRRSEGWSISWECDLCLKETVHEKRTLPGFYNSGRPSDPSNEEHDPDKPPIQGCMRCESPSSLLQVVLRRK